MHGLIPRGREISPVQFWLLLILSEGPNYGYQIIQRLREMFGGYWEPKAGTIYPALERLRRAGLVSSRVEHREEAPDRRYYRITERGREAIGRAMTRWSRLIEHIEAYGEAHRAIRRFRGQLSRRELGDLLQELGRGLERGSFDLSEVLPQLEAIRVEPTEPLDVKFLYAWDEGRLEIEMEFEWIPRGEGGNRRSRSPKMKNAQAGSKP
ncbi:MAG: PadR family transcriptional regulator [Candidatus Bathyarchaeota archaeon B23]|nr:MAG: PadR family transcriptional regulator [Candidatus Bathyarchaeota archaeon B23]